MKKLKDIRKNLPQNIDITDGYPLSEISTSKKASQNTNDILGVLEDVDLQKSRDILLTKNKTHFFDSVSHKSFRLGWTLDMSQKSYFSKILEKLSGASGLMYGSIILLVCISVLFVAKISVENRVNAGYAKLLSFSQSDSDFGEVRQTINDARFDFLLSDILFTPFKLLPGNDINNGYHAIKGGKMLTKSIDDFFRVYDKTLEFTKSKDIKSIYFTQLLQNIRPEFLRIEDELRSTLSHYTSIKDLGDPVLETKLAEQIVNLEFLLKEISLVNNNFDIVLDTLGHSARKKYLIVFQNSDEIRPTGGFMGSMAILDIFRGQIKEFQPRDVYSFEWDLKRSDYIRVPPPRGIDVLTSSFGLRDANYYVNLKDSSEAIKFFVEKSGQDIDGIIYLNQNILLKLLSLTGDIPFDVIERDITSENFSEVMSLLVEAKLFKEGTQGTPKQILFDFIKVLEKTVLEQKNYGAYLKLLLDSFQNRELMMYSFSRNENALLRELGLGGEKNYDETFDFSYPVFTSLSGNKSDRYMERSFRKEISIAQDCRVDTTFSLISKHTFNASKKEEIQSMIDEYEITTPNILEIQGNGDNYQFVRVILPYGSEIVPQDGMVIMDYGKRKGVEFYLRTEPTQTVVYDIDYSLINTDCMPYSYKLYKQPGIPNYDIEMISPEKQESFSGLESDFFYSIAQ